ncbi:FixH family protein [Parapedobacter indicus]|uniref:YtkA-like n=1 Tax=Parapedobacter indicus TaxID=1477437 RepID=A0A1I3NMR3_9SPHI|nr:FixH family protein [Parapedobacter indicus]PPL01033.1 YtkA-like protein [Parapedobacter indicus]SFJ10561.1 YtkA-like [Parapedobacter indicus]
MTRPIMKGIAVWCALMVVMHILISCNGGEHQADNTDTADSGFAGERMPTDEALIPVGDTTLSGTGLQVSLFSETALSSRYENLYLKVERTDGTPVSGAGVVFSPLMDMGMMSHGAPHAQPVELTNGWYCGSAVFIMPDVEDMGRGWLLNVALSIEGKTDSLTFKLPIMQAAVTRTMTFDAGGEGRFFISLLMPDSVGKGRHKTAFLLHGIDQDAFPAADGYSIQLKTAMPGMGHGSKGNTDALSQGSGKYEGTVDFNMPGLWELHGKLFKDGKQVSTDPIVFKVDVTG